MSTAVDTLLVNESQARELVGLESEVAARVMDLAAESNEKVTARAIREAARLTSVVFNFRYVEHMPEIPLRLITPADVRASVDRAKRALAKAAEEIVWQRDMESWVTLGHSSWGAFREAEYSGAAVMVPAKDRPEMRALANSSVVRARRDDEIRQRRSEGESIRAIAESVGCSVGTAHRVIKAQD